MNIDDTIYELIEKYLGGLMSVEEKASFEQRMASNPELTDQVRIFEMMPGYLDDQSIPASDFEASHPKAKAYLDEFLKEDTQALRGHLDDHAAEYIAGNQRQSGIGLMKVVRIAAVLVVLLGAAFFLFRPDSPQQLYGKYTDHQELMLNVRGESDQEKLTAEQMFNAGKYAEAIPVLEKLDISLGETGQDNYDLKLALGISYLETGEQENALKIFEYIYSSNALNRSDALYYIAMTQLREGDRQQARSTLEQFQKEFPDYRSESVGKLLRTL